VLFLLLLDYKEKKMKASFQNVVWKEDELYVAQCLNIDISSFGETKAEALSNLEEALELYFEDVSFDEATIIENPEIISTELEHA
jgi:predicted RNase H-like HicB family nuclease